MDIISVYNPANANITADEIAAMKDLTNEQIASLANAYPNQPSGNAYLVYYNTKEALKDQRYPLGTWSNLNNLRRLGQDHILPYNFFKKHNVNKAQEQRQNPIPSRVVDLGAEEKIEGIKSAPVLGTATPDVPVAPVTPIASDAEEKAIDAKLAELQAQLKQAQDEKAHHMTIKSIEKQIDDHKAGLVASK